MKAKKLLLRSILVLGILVLALTPILVSCSSSPATTSTQAANTLKVGVVFWNGWSLGQDAIHAIEIEKDMINSKGGLDIGGKKYTIQLIEYDSGFVPETAKAAVDRLISQDKVSFIVGDEMCINWVADSEAAKVLSVDVSPTPGLLNPAYKYTFQGSTLNTSAAPAWGWYATSHPELKTIVNAFPDNEIGHTRADLVSKMCALWGPKILDTIFYPPTATDLSVVATKVLADNPDSFTATAGGVTGDNLCYKAVYEAGYKGVKWSFVGSAVDASLKVVAPEVLEGMVMGEAALETPNPPPFANDFKNAWIAKYGSWTHPSASFGDTFNILTTALNKAGTLDTTKVADVIANGMTFEGLGGSSKMIARPDLGNSRTVDTLSAGYMIQVKNGQSTLVKNLSIDECTKYDATLYGWK